MQAHSNSKSKNGLLWNVFKVVTIVVAPFFLPFLIENKAPMDRDRPLIENPEALDKAQTQVNQLNLRQELAKNGYVIVDEFYGLHGFSTNSMEKLTRELQEQNIHVVYEPLMVMPPGIIQFNSLAILFLLYCHGEDRKTVIDFLNKKYGRPWSRSFS